MNLNQSPKRYKCQCVFPKNQPFIINWQCQKHKEKASKSISDMKVTKYGRPDTTRRLLASVVLMMLLSKWCIHSSACPRSGNVIERINMAKRVNLEQFLQQKLEQKETTVEKYQQATETEPILGPKHEVSRNIGTLMF